MWPVAAWGVSAAERARRRILPFAVVTLLAASVAVPVVSCDRPAPTDGRVPEPSPAAATEEPQPPSSAANEASAQVAAPDPVAAPHPDAHPDTGAPPAPCGTPAEGMACVPGGWFVRGLDADPHSCDQMDQPRDGRSSLVPSSRVWVDTFYIDVTEVTNAAYQECVSAGDCERAGPLYRDFDAPTQPITGLTWFQARDFCRWRNARLPTDAEFEKASRGPDGELHPWGDAPADCARAIIMDDTGRACGVQKRGQHPESGRIWEVASRPPGRYGLHDMVGNAEEWTADWWTTDWATCGADCAGPDPRGPCNGVDDCPGHRYRSVRGGSWYWPAQHATGPHRRRYPPNNDPPHHFGFRCAVGLSSAAVRRRR